MTYNAKIHHRRSIRLKGYDYSQAGAYFVTICCQNRMSLFGEIVEEEMRLAAAGEMVQTVWDEIPAHYRGIDVAEFVVMPNHVHGIIVIDHVSDDHKLSLPAVVHRFKTMTTKRYTDGVKQFGWLPFPGRLWQRNYWEHVIRNESDYSRIAEYIQHNPAQWAQDKLNPCRQIS